MKDGPNALENALAEAISREGRAVRLPKDSIVGRWAGDRVVLVGDYDESKLWDELDTYRNISRQVVETWNDFIDVEKMRLNYRSACDLCRQ